LIDRTPKAAWVSAYVRVDHSIRNGFMLPLLRVEGDQTWLVQRADDITDSVHSFATFNEEMAEVKAVPKPVLVRTGDPQIYAFFDGAEIHVGTKMSLESTLRDFTVRNPDNIATALQVYKMVGSPSERRDARRKMTNVIQDRMGRRVANDFCINSLETSFWTKLLSAWDLNLTPDRRERIKHRFRVSMAENGKINVQHVDPQTPAERKSLRHVISEVAMEFGNTLRPARHIDPVNMVIDEAFEMDTLRTINLTITGSGVFFGRAEVENADVAGVFEGDITAQNLIVRSTGTILGVARCRRLQVEDSGQIKGRIEMLSDRLSSGGEPSSDTDPQQVPISAKGRP
jgi:hypothetical protein